MNIVLRLDKTGTPNGWLNREEAATAIARGSVLWTLGDTCTTLRGGTQRCSGLRSEIRVPSIIAVDGVRLSGFVPALDNRLLFKRDDHRCMYCGQQDRHRRLTRDHVIPVSRGGSNAWRNVVAACSHCNNRKADRTPEEAHMPLLAVPFAPNVFEWHYLAGHRILGDQMEYLRSRFSGKRHWLAGKPGAFSPPGQRTGAEN
jgi:5-methylcytosine-specific restriction endonuclease McrA